MSEDDAAGTSPQPRPSSNVQRPVEPVPHPMFGYGLTQLRHLSRRDRHMAVIKAFVRAVGAAALLIAGYYLMPLGDMSDVEVVVRVVLAGVLVVSVIVWEIRAVNRAAYPQLRAVEALVVTVFVIVIAFAASYLNMSHHQPNAFNVSLSRTSSLYFTITTLATVGYGDIHPDTDHARIVVMVQMVANVAVLGASVKLILGTVRHRVSSQQLPPSEP